MKLLLLVSLPLLASTNVTLAKSTLHEGRQKVSDSLDMSPRRLSSDRNLMQSTTSGTRHQAENAEERSHKFHMEELAAKLGLNGKGLVPALRKNHELPPEALFLKLNFKKEAIALRSPEFETWFHAVQKRDGKDAGKTIIKALIGEIPDETKLASMLYRTRKETPRDKKGEGSYDYFLSYLDQINRDPDEMLLTFKLNEPENIKNFKNPLRGVWLDYAEKVRGDDYIAAKYREIVSGALMKNEDPMPLHHS